MKADAPQGNVLARTKFLDGNRATTKTTKTSTTTTTNGAGEAKGVEQVQGKEAKGAPSTKGALAEGTGAIAPPGGDVVPVGVTPHQASLKGAQVMLARSGALEQAK